MTSSLRVTSGSRGGCGLAARAGAAGRAAPLPFKACPLDDAPFVANFDGIAVGLLLAADLCDAAPFSEAGGATTAGLGGLATRLGGDCVRPAGAEPRATSRPRTLFDFCRAALTRALISCSFRMPCQPGTPRFLAISAKSFAL